MCLAVSGAPAPGPVDSNRHLAATDRFVVVPALGPLAVGHLLVVGMRHIPSLADEGEPAIEEYEQFVAGIREGFRSRGHSLLEFEHGAKGSESGGGCIVHTHVNLLPDAEDHLEVLTPILGPPRRLRRLADLAQVDHPYVLVRSAAASIIYRAEDIVSQLMRREICRARGEDDWDWAVSQRFDLVEATIRFWLGSGSGDAEP